MTSPFKRSILDPQATEACAGVLSPALSTLVDLALLLKQAHWNVVGKNFHPIHEQLDEIVDNVQEASDSVAERLVQLGVSPDGRAATVAKDSKLAAFPDGFQGGEATIQLTSDAVKSAIDVVRVAIDALGDLDPISEDLCIGISADLEKHLWMLQAQEC
jgi:starvation-inducible DNA-binding protein